MKNIQVISLGDNCFARYIVTKAGIKPSKSQRELSMPFDLAVHFTKYVPWLIKHRFRGYLRGFVFNQKENVYTVHIRKHLFRKRHNVAWLNHDTDLQGNIKLLKLRYKNRIKSFYDVLKQNQTFMFVQNVSSPYNVQPLIDVLDKIVKNYYLVLLDISGTMQDVYKKDNVKIIHCPYPYQGYIWYDEHQRNSPDGVEFEHNVVKELKKIYKEIKK